MKKISIIILMLFLTFSCSSKKSATQTSTQNTNRVWMLVAFKDYKKEYLIEKKAFLDLTNPNRASAKMGCNNLSFPYSIKNNKFIVFSQGISTKMACPEMQLENDFSTSITNTTEFSINAHQLTLTSNNGEKMVFVAQDWD